MKRFSFLCILFALLAFLNGCRGVGVENANKYDWLELHARNAANSNGLDVITASYLVSEALDGIYDDDPEQAYKAVEAIFLENRRRSPLSALVEICAAQYKGSSDEEQLKWLIRLCRYSSQYIFDDTVKPPLASAPIRFDAVRLYYNFSVGEVFNHVSSRIPRGESKCVLSSGNESLELDIDCGRVGIPLAMFTSFMSCYDYLPYGMISYSYRGAFGAPVMGVLGNYSRADAAAFPFFGKSQIMPMTAFLDYSPDFSSRAKLSLVNTLMYETLSCGREKVYLTYDFTTPLAMLLQKPELITALRLLFYPGDIRDFEGMYMLAPYQPDKIPVVFVHGLMSNPRTWVQTINVLLSDTRIRNNYQFWFFAYATGNPIIYSASLLRKSLLQAKQTFDPKGDNPYFKRMVLVGHSMGGILSKTMVQNSGDKLLQDMLGKPVSELKLEPDQEAFLTELFVLERLSFVERAIFVAAPHRGSELAVWSLSRWVSSLISIPDNLRNTAKKVLVSIRLKSNTEPIYVATGIDNLDPNSKILLKLAQTPIDTRVPCHSVIGDIDKAGHKNGSDGVVPYSSSHLDCTVSELIVKSGHSVHSTPDGIREIRRILLEHIGKGVHYNEDQAVDGKH